MWVGLCREVSGRAETVNFKLREAGKSEDGAAIPRGLKSTIQIIPMVHGQDTEDPTCPESSFTSRVNRKCTAEVAFWF